MFPKKIVPRISQLRLREMDSFLLQRNALPNALSIGLDAPNAPESSSAT